MNSVSPEAIDWVEKLHAVVDEAAAPVERSNAKRLHCRAGCADCCIDELTVFEIEAAVIRRHHAELLANGEPHPAGACAFLDADSMCRIYAQRPYVCRTQGLPLRWIEEDELEGEIVESRDICPKNMDGPPVEELTAEECWTLGPFEQRLAERQASVDGGRGNRVALRSLFERRAPDGAESHRRRLPIVDP